MTDFKAKMHQIRFRLGLRPRGRGWAGEEEGKGRGKLRGSEREGPKLLLNEGPSEPCYATAYGSLR